MLSLRQFAGCKWLTSNKVWRQLGGLNAGGGVAWLRRGIKMLFLPLWACVAIKWNKQSSENRIEQGRAGQVRAEQVDVDVEVVY